MVAGVGGGGGGGGLRGAGYDRNGLEHKILTPGDEKDQALVCVLRRGICRCVAGGGLPLVLASFVLSPQLVTSLIND